MTHFFNDPRVHFIRNALDRRGRRVLSASSPPAFAQDDARQATAQWRRIADQLRPKVPKLATLTAQAEADVLAYMSFPAQHRAKLHSTNALERLNGEIKRRTRLVGAILLEQNDEWAVNAPVTSRWEAWLPVGDDPLVGLPDTAA